MKPSALANLILLIIFSGYTLFVVLSGEANLFFIIYLYFLDEVIKNIFLSIKSIRLKALGYSVQNITAILKVRFFMLFIYSVFIVLVFGLFHGLMVTGRDELGRNILVFFFKDLYFNISIAIITIKESINLFMELRNQKKISGFVVEPMDTGMMVLHLSIIFGAAIWFLTSGKFEYFHLSFGAYNKVAIIFPFLLIKLIFDLNAVRKEWKKSMKIN